MKIVYFNNSATSFPKAPGTAEAVAGDILKVPVPSGRRSANRGNDPLCLCRSILADMMGVDSACRIVFCSNSTQALNTAVRGIGLKQGERIITTAVEHNSVLRPLYHIARKMQIQLDIVPADSQGRIDTGAFMEILRRGPVRMVVANHASNVTGAVNDTAEIFLSARKSGAVTLLDASQTLGVVPVLPALLNADMTAFTGHKYLLGPAGTGGLHISEGIILEPLITGGTGTKSLSPYQPEDMPGYFEAGTPNIPGFAGLAHALRWKMENKTKNPDLLIERLEEGLSSVNGVRIIRVSGRRTPVLSVVSEKFSPEEMGYMLEESFGIVSRAGLHCAPLIHRYIGTAPAGTLRLSPSFFNTLNEVDYVVDSLMRLHR